jgi:hypothetical protein
MATQSKDSGLLSLSGFSFQIKVLILYITTLDKNRQVEFETLEDVVENKESVPKDFLDKKSEYFNTFQQDGGSLQAIQVKRTKLTTATLKKVLFNWLLLESTVDIEKYILFTDAEYNNKDELFNITPDCLYKEVITSNLKSNALKTKVKNQFEDLISFKKSFNAIKSKYLFSNLQNIDKKISEQLEKTFHKSALSQLKYNLRVENLIDIINAEVMESVFHKKPYICNEEKFMKHVEDICSRINKEEYRPESFSSFKKSCFINFSDKGIFLSREYIQLQHCKPNQHHTERHLLYKQYYESYRDSLLLDNSETLINDLELKTHDNFCDTKDYVESESKDTPLNRLTTIKDKRNNYSCNEDIRVGSCIYLTKKNILKNLQISWKEEDE